MTVNAEEIQRRIDIFERACKEKGAKLTMQRLEIFREIAKSEEHPPAEAIYQAVSTRLPTISLDTVYRTLWWLSELGLVVPLGPEHGTRFDANMTHHHHFVCAECGLTRDFSSQDLDRLEVPESITAIGSIEGAQVVVKGICHSCAEKRRSSANKT